MRFPTRLARRIGLVVNALDALAQLETPDHQSADDLLEVAAILSGQPRAVQESDPGARGLLVAEALRPIRDALVKADMQLRRLFDQAETRLARAAQRGSDAVLWTREQGLRVELWKPAGAEAWVWKADTSNTAANSQWRQFGDVAQFPYAGRAPQEEDRPPLWVRADLVKPYEHQPQLVRPANESSGVTPATPPVPEWWGKPRRMF